MTLDGEKTDRPERTDPAPPSATELVQAVHDSRHQLVLAMTGGGSAAIGQLLCVPGASRSVLEARVPYAAAAMNDWLGAVPDSYCSERTARRMAMAAYQRAQELSDSTFPLIGVGATASLASDRPKRGAHRIHAALQTSARTERITLQLEKNARSRAEEESIVSRFLLNLVARGCGVRAQLRLPLLNSESFQSREVTAPVAWQQLLIGAETRVAVGTPPEASCPALFPGAFDPRHSGHRGMAAIAGQVLGCPIAHELSIENVDKPSLDFIEIEDRLTQFAGTETVWLTKAATFVAKAELFPGTTFVVGTDTIRRIADPDYYQSMKMTVGEVIDRITKTGCRFLVFGREERERFVSLSDLTLPAQLANLCQAVSENDFRDDISSTELRGQAADDDD